MKYFLLVLLAAISFTAQSAEIPIRRNFVTTNTFMNAPSDGWIAIWNNTAKQWSNGLNTASSTNAAQPPSTVLSNLAISRIVYVATNDNVSLVLSNAQNNTAYILPSFTFAITPSVLSSNLTGGTQYRGITFANKTNVLIYGQKGSTIIDGSSEYGELLVITNSSGITVDGIAWYGKTNHNWTQVIPTNHLWAGIRIANSEKITFQNNDISRHFNHGICDLAANFFAVPASTNQILIQNNLFEDAGSWRTNISLAYDGTAIVPTGWTVRGNKIKNVLRGIEPYLADNGQPSVIWNCIIENNDIENAYDYGITTAGNTNFRGARVTGNTIRTHPGFAFHGSNALYSVGAGILWNGGHDWVIENNIVSGAFPNGIQTGGNTEGGSVSRNTIFGITNAIGTYGGLQLNNSYRLSVIGNKLRGPSGLAQIYLYGLRDSEVSGNQIINPSFSGAGIRVATYGSLVTSNITIKDNFIFDSVNSRLTYGIEDQQLPGNFKIRLSGNEIQNAGTKYYFPSNLTEWTIRDLDAGSTNRLIAAHEVRTQIEAGSNITLATNSSGVVTITGAAGSGTPGGNSADVQFNQSGSFAGTNTFTYDRTNNIATAGSFYGSGTGVPIIKLQTMMAADNALAFSVRTNFTQLSTNFFEFTSPAAGQGMSLHSAANGQLVWTNTSRAVLTNMVGLSFDYGLLYAATNTVAGTNFAINFSPNNTNHIDFFTTNWWCQWTNISGLAQGSLASKTIRITPSAPGSNLTNVWPVGSQHGIYRWVTNANSPILTVLTTGKTYVLSLTAYGTNIHASMSLWEP